MTPEGAARDGRVCPVQGRRENTELYPCLPACAWRLDNGKCAVYSIAMHLAELDAKVGTSETALRTNLSGDSGGDNHNEEGPLASSLASGKGK